MQIVLNGQPYTLDRAQTVGELLQALTVKTDGIAVALNLSVIPRTEWYMTPIKEADRVEIIRAVAGG